LAANRGFTAILQLLLDRGFDVNATDKAGNTALDEAAWKGEAEAARLLLKRGAKPQSAVYAAANRGHAALIGILADAGADLRKPDKSGATALELALGNRHAAVIEALNARGVKPSNDAPLRNAVLRGDYDLVATLLKSGMDAKTPYLLHDAALKGHLKIVELLIARGADPRVKNAQGATAVHDAALTGQTEVVRFLLDQGVPADEPDSESGATPLHNAAAFGRAPVVELLLEHGADPNRPNKAGQTPLAAAKVNEHQAVAQLLEAKGAR
jgi:ankyrin repeat protein